MGRILLTGASGFVGRQLLARLAAKGMPVTVALRVGSDLPIPQGDVRVARIDGIGPTTDWSAALEGCDRVVHLAAQVPGRGIPDATYTFVNERGTARLVEQARQAGIQRFVFLSTIFAVIDNASANVVGDDTPPAPSTAYGRSKLAAEKHVLAFADADRTAVILRPPLVYGAQAKGNWRLLQRLAATGLPLPFGAVNNRRGMIFLDNLVDALVAVLRAGPQPAQSGAYAVADARPVSLRDVLSWLREGMGRAPRLLAVPPVLMALPLKLLGRGQMAQSLFGDLEIDSHRFQQAFGWNPPHDPRAAIAACGADAASPRGEGASVARAGTGGGLKRLFDLAASLGGLVVLSPVMLVVAIIVRRTSPGGALFAQDRVGLHEKPFRCYKFRTMASGAPVAGSHHVSSSWITPVGKRLRAWKLDELPQLYNVLRGEMSLVGPRPCLPNQADVIGARRREGVYAIRPGITGPAQLAGIDMSTPDALAAADRRYMETRSFLGDLRILVRTALGGGSGDAVKS